MGLGSLVSKLSAPDKLGRPLAAGLSAGVQVTSLSEEVRDLREVVQGLQGQLAEVTARMDARLQAVSPLAAASDAFAVSPATPALRQQAASPSLQRPCQSSPSVEFPRLAPQAGALWGKFHFGERCNFR